MEYKFKNITIMSSMHPLARKIPKRKVLFTDNGEPYVKIYNMKIIIEKTGKIWHLSNRSL